MSVTEVATGVWRAGTRFVNWYVVDGGAEGLTVVDAGLPGYRSRLDKSLADIGRSRTDVRAVILTHGHIDHIGFANVLAGSGATVHLHPDDAGLAAAPKTNKTDSSGLPYLRWPATWAFVGHCVKEGALRPQPMPDAVPLVDGTVADAPGKPLVRHAPGHTDGSCVLEFREHGVVFVGDLLCTINPATGRRADPQLQTRGSNRNSDQAMASLDRLDGIDARLVLPGHGGPWQDGVQAAAASARKIGCR
jgi:glyoxylase-like metal-dependent hydrolase (beta-lactamase superfamily II)